jgi:uncharacterized membrane protein YhaH (DUF805 family)
MLDLIRSSEGEISRADFRKAAPLLFSLTAIVFAVIGGIVWLSVSMEWMTVAVSPFFGAVALVFICSLVYFWYCLIAKRLRNIGHPLHALNTMLALGFLAGGAYLLHYQDRTLNLQFKGVIGWAGEIASLLFALAVLVFLGLVSLCWTREEGSTA